MVFEQRRQFLTGGITVIGLYRVAYFILVPKQALATSSVSWRLARALMM
ncbi:MULTISPECIES: hypothetical protein [unclassified Mesorhizobium]|nr:MULTISPECIES: hypothetical protein [unclassified Mesorhizobium]